MAEPDPALDYLLADLKASGMSVRDYERLYGIMLMPAEMSVAEREVPLEQQRAAHCRCCARRHASEAEADRR